MAIDFPMDGLWTAQNSPADRVPSHGTALFGSSYAIDFVMLDKRRSFYRGSLVSYLLFGVAKEDCHGYGQPVLSATAGEVVEAVDGIPERPRVNVWKDLAYASAVAKRAARGAIPKTDLVGNYVMVQTAGNFIIYAHLKPGSIAVKKGQQVTSSQLLGQIGHSGNSTAPHLHLQVVDNADHLKAQAVPFVFRSLRVEKRGDWTVANGYVPRNGETVRGCR